MTGSSEAYPDYFSGLAADYAAFRPTYPPALIVALAKLAPARERAWDCATGNGQAALLLAGHFESVIATDASAQQLAHAPAHPRIRYVEAHAEESSLATSSIDLVTVAQALHWFDVPRFHREVARVLRPGGVIAEWCYSLARVDAAIDSVVDRFYEGRVGRFWPPERRHIEVLYRDLEFPFDPLPAADFEMRAELSLAGFLGYVATWSAVTVAREEQKLDPLPELARALEPVWPANENRSVHWPFAMRVGQRRE